MKNRKLGRTKMVAAAMAIALGAAACTDDPDDTDPTDPLEPGVTTTVADLAPTTTVADLTTTTAAG